MLTGFTKVVLLECVLMCLIHLHSVASKCNGMPGTAT